MATTRRGFLAGAAALGAGLVIAACGGDDDDASSSSTAPRTGTSGAGTGTTVGNGGSDLKVAALAAGLEVLAVGTYQAALDAADKNALGAVPPAVGEFITTAKSQHQAHLDAWNKVLEQAGEATVSEPNATLKPTVDAEFAKVTDVAGAAKLALVLEQTAAATYLKAQHVLSDKAAILLAGSIQIVDAQHAAILLYVLGEYPVPETFAGTDLAVAA